MSCCFGELLFLVESPEQVVQVGGGEAPVERHRGLLVAVLEAEQPLGHLAKVGEVVGGQDLALHDREVDLDLVQPRGVDRQVDQREVLPSALQPVDRAWPRCEEPLSTTQNTRRAEAYGSVAITCSTRRPKGWMPVVGSHRPNSRAWCTSQAAR